MKYFAYMVCFLGSGKLMSELAKICICVSCGEELTD